MLFAHLKGILKMRRLRLRVLKVAQDEFTLAAIAKDLRRPATLVAQSPPAAARVRRRPDTEEPASPTRAC